MSTQLPTDAEAFYCFLGEQIQNGGREKSPEALLSYWRHRRAQAIEDIQQGMRDWEAGRYRPIEEVDAYIRDQLGFPPREKS